MNSSNEVNYAEITYVRVLGSQPLGVIKPIEEAPDYSDKLVGAFTSFNSIVVEHPEFRHEFTTKGPYQLRNDELKLRLSTFVTEKLFTHQPPTIRLSPQTGSIDSMELYFDPERKTGDWYELACASGGIATLQALVGHVFKNKEVQVKSFIQGKEIATDLPDEWLKKVNAALKQNSD